MKKNEFIIILNKKTNKKMNDQQQIAIDYWNAGSNVKITAVPGAGKSRVLLEACKLFTNGILIILAYNHDLCEETKNKIIEEGLEDQVICMTFHGLATYCIMPTYDDTALFDAIEGVESGEITVQHVISVAGVLIDEAQDIINQGLLDTIASIHKDGLEGKCFFLRFRSKKNYCFVNGNCNWSGNKFL